MWQIANERALWLGQQVMPHEPALRSWLRRWRMKGLEIDDVVQETYTRLITAESIEHITSPKTYLFQIAGSVVIDHLRRMKIVSIDSVADMAELGIASDEPSPERRVIDRDELRRLARAISALPNKIREVFILRRVHGLPQKEVANRLGITESTVEKHMSRGFLLMLKLYNDGGNAPSPSSDTVRGRRAEEKNGKEDSTRD
ncbi:MAG: RNA polymerase sigma factor [Rhizomicrobium sp.]|nr:RNA polymerase sigma factor [Rhizomicrobium sp.]